MSSTLIDVWDDPHRAWPSIAYIETTNKCNARCLPCLNHRCKRVRGIMAVDDFRTIADILGEHSVKIGAMFCFGEPLLDPTIFEKFKYAGEKGLFTQHVGFNTNVSKLTPEMYDDILAYVPNIILSFFNTGEDFNRLTGNLDWNDCYGRAVRFIKYRDSVKPGYKIFIGCNAVNGYSLDNIKEAFENYNVEYAHDAELRWGGEVITGVIDRMIMYNDWRCDGCKGALQIKWNGDCEFCAYDIIGSPEGGETKFGNILADEWGALKDAFRAKWREPSSLCKRCDYFYLAKTVAAHGFKRPEPLPVDWYDWQKPYVNEGQYVK